jgi:hypothetical protein
MLIRLLVYSSNIQLYVRKNIRKSAIHDVNFRFPLLVPNAFFFENVRIISTNRYNRKRKDIKLKKITDVTNDSFFVASFRKYLLLL